MEVSELFDICRTLAEGQQSAAALQQMHELLVLTCAYGGRQQGGAFGNLFSQVDWLCKHHGIGYEDMLAIQTARRHSSHPPKNSNFKLQTSNFKLQPSDFLYDLRAVSIFISAVFGVSVPGELRCLLPSLPQPRQKGLRINREHIRVVVRSFDAQLIVADSDDGELTIDYATTEQGRDFGYLRKVLREGMQLNLLDCHMEADRVTPGQIIVEPDFLIDISSLAACFTSYGHHPLLYTVNRLKPQANTQAILLGHFAGAALDDIISQPDANMERTLQRARQEHALRFASCENLDMEHFRQDAERQMQNIRQAVGVLKDTLSDKALLEPSFVCERLGLQGRVDLMTTDMSLLVEQKAGKNMKIEYQSHDAHGLQREDHYVQLLLYYGVLRYNFGKSDRQVDTRLLYSRYPADRGLLTVNYYRALLREALKLRNQIVATEFLIACDGFGRILPLLNSDVIYKGVARDAFFHRYIEPELHLLTSHLSSLTSIERAYFERMMTFVYREQLCDKLGVEEGHGSSTADLWQMPLAEKLETGSIFTDLTITSRDRSQSYGGYDLITLTFGSDQVYSRQSNFRRGDMVYLYSYRQQPDVCHSILYKATLTEMAPDHLVVQLSDGQQNPDIFPISDSQHWAIEHGGSDSNTSAAIRGLRQLMTCQPRRRSLLLGQRRPEADTTQVMSRSYHPDYDDIVQRIHQSCDYFLLVGPPGTGKTSKALRYIVEEELQREDSQLLLTAYTNRAVDEICEMLCDAAIPFVRIGNAASCDPRYHDYLWENYQLSIINSPFSIPQIVVGTTSMLQARSFLFRLMHFSLAIVDEASQILEPSIVGLLSNDSIDRFVLIGDYKQLPAVVQQSEQQAAVTEPCLRDICLTDCRQSLFERLIRWEMHCGCSQFMGTLRKQGRMHPDIALFPNRHFYQREQIDIVPCPHQQEPSLGYEQPSEDQLDDALKNRRVMFMPVQPDDLSGSRSNVAEARVVADLLRRIYRFYGDRFSAATTVGVIVPYRNQIAAISSEISLLGIPELQDITIDTVERYQGSQRDVIIYSFTVSRIYQLDFLTSNSFMEGEQTIDRKLNVALTRARRQMLMVGNPTVLRHDPLFRQIVENYS